MLLKIDNIFKSYQINKPGNRRYVLEGLSLSVDKGETISILGPSGSGKSTLLNIIGTLDKQDRGEILFDGISVSGLSEAQLTRLRNREVGFIFQAHHLLPQCTVLENVLLPTIPVKDPGYRKESHERALHLIKEVGLWEQHNQRPEALSGGECQRAAVIRALINKPRLLLADEPTGSLDRENALFVASLMLKLNNEFGTSLVVVTHSREIAEMMDKIYELKNGKLEINHTVP
jgi:lipoprotein-releasing system ATP-binding protein